MKAIVCVDDYWGIGKNNSLLFNFSEDTKHFRKETLNKVVIMGLNTFKSLPNGPLKDRINIVLDSSSSCIEGVTVVPSIFKLSLETSKYNSEDLVVIGGASVYKQLLPFCSEVLVTRVADNGHADKFFPNLDALSNWRVAQKSGELIAKSGLRYSFYVYKQKEAQDD